MSDSKVLTIQQLAQLVVVEYRSLTILANIGHILTLDISPADSIKLIKKELLARGPLGMREDRKLSLMLEEFAQFFLTGDNNLPQITIVDKIHIDALFNRLKEKKKVCDDRNTQLDAIATILTESDQDSEKVCQIQYVMISFHLLDK
jgi:hypothetical protein